LKSNLSTMTLRYWLIAASVAIVALWRAAALARPSSLVAIPENLRIPMALLGLLFLVCGAWAWWKRPGRWTLIFLVYCIGAGVHWGGTIDPGHRGVELSLLLVYLAFSAMAEAGLLHLALVFPSGRSLGTGVRIAIYSVAVLALIAAPFAAVLSSHALDMIAGIVLLLANLFSLAAGLLFVVSLVRLEADVSRATRLPLVVAGLLSAFVVSTLGTQGILLPQSEAWNLANGALPFCLAYALGGHGRMDRLRPPSTR
jgi:hypothetical protein